MLENSNLIEILCHIDTMTFLIYLCDIEVILISTVALLGVGSVQAWVWCGGLNKEHSISVHRGQTHLAPLCMP